MRIAPTVVALLSCAALLGCDQSGTDELGPEQQQAAEPTVTELALAAIDEPVADDQNQDTADSLVTVSDPAGDTTTCAEYKFSSRSTTTSKTACLAPVPEPDLPDLIDWEDLTDREIEAAAAAACSAAGARNGAGQLPGFGLPGPFGLPLPGLPSLPDGDPDALAAAPDTTDPEAAVAPAACQTFCASQGKMWNSATENFGTCAVDLTIATTAPKHKTTGASCPMGTRRWKIGGAAQFDCGCNCV